MEKKKVTFIGSGIIGTGLAVNALMHGCDVTVWYRRNYEKLETQLKTILKVFSDNQILSEEEAAAGFAAIHFTTDLEEAVRESEFIQESIAEELSLKQEIYRKIQKIRGDQTIIASSTSLLFPSALSKGALHPDRIVVGHPYNPAYLMPIMEICGGETASEETVLETQAVYESWGKVPVICKKEVKGFIVNEINQSVTRICREQVVNGICSAEDMDKAVMFGPGLRMAILGQLLTTSLGVEGGFRNLCAKYRLPHNPDYDLLGDEIDAVYASRTEEEGRDPEHAARYRDKMIIQFLQMKHRIL